MARYGLEHPPRRESFLRNHRSGLAWSAVIALTAGLVGYAAHEFNEKLRAHSIRAGSSPIVNLFRSVPPEPASSSRIDYDHEVIQAYKDGRNADPDSRLEAFLRGYDMSKASGFAISDPLAVPVQDDMALFVADHFKSKGKDTAAAGVYLDALSFMDDQKENAIAGLEEISQRTDIISIVAQYGRKDLIIDGYLGELSRRYIGSILQRSVWVIDDIAMVGKRKIGNDEGPQIDRKEDAYFNTVRNWWEIRDSSVREHVAQELRHYKTSTEEFGLFLRNLKEEHKNSSGFRRRVLGAALDFYSIHEPAPKQPHITDEPARNALYSHNAYNPGTFKRGAQRHV